MAWVKSCHWLIPTIYRGTAGGRAAGVDCDTRWTCPTVYGLSSPSPPPPPLPNIFLSTTMSFQLLFLFLLTSNSPHPSLHHFPISLSLSLSPSFFLIRTCSLWHVSLTPLHLIERETILLGNAGEIRHLMNVYRAQKHQNTFFIFSLSWSLTHWNNNSVWTFDPSSNRL